MTKTAFIKIQIAGLPHSPETDFFKAALSALVEVGGIQFHFFKSDDFEQKLQQLFHGFGAAALAPVCFFADHDPHPG